MHGCQIPGDLIAEQIFSDKSGASMVCRQRLPKAVKACSVLTAHGSRLLTAAAWRGTGTHDGVGDLQRDESETN